MRLDQAMLERGLCESRARAQAAIGDGIVTVNGEVCRKASRKVAPGDVIGLTGEVLPWVSRAALKLVHGLDHFGVDVAGAEALDLGASTGGFSEVLLARGAAHVTAVDVGHGQLHERLKGAPRLTYLEGVNVRGLSAGQVPAPDLIVSDLSFISLTKALGAPLALARPGARLIALVKPQFELGPGRVGKGGVVKDAADRAAALEGVIRFLDGLGWRVEGSTESPVAGSDGNVEFLLAARVRTY